MSGFAHFAVTHARFTWLLITAICLGGMSVFLTQPRQEDPEVTVRGAQVVTTMPGLSPERIEQLITRPIEEKIKTIAEVEEIKSISTTGLSIVQPEVSAQFNDMTPIWADLRNKMEEMAGQLPSGAQGPRVNDDYGRVSVITLAISGDEYSLADLESAARDVRDVLSTLPLVARIDLFGVQAERIWIEFDSALMVQLGVAPAAVVQALNSQNVVIAGGTVEANGQSVVIEPSGDLRSLEELRAVSVQTEEGKLLYLTDIATVRRGYVDPPESPAYFNGRPAIVLGISMVAKSNVVELGRQVRASLAEIEPTLPLGMDLDVAIFQPDLVQESVNSATENLLQTMAVVLLVVMVFLGLRTGLIVGAMVPLTMMVTLIGMSLWGIELHRISIAAIIVALGLLVDNGVVIAEDIQQRLEGGMDRLAAALATPRVLAIPLLTSSLTTVAAFMPLVLITGGSGEFLRALGQVLAIALLASWFIAITVTPAFCYWFFPKDLAKKRTDETESYTSFGYRLYRRVLTGALRFRLVFLLGLGVLFVSSLAVFTQVKQRSLGPSERNQFTIYLDLPAEAAITETMESAGRLSAYLNDRDANPEVTDVLAYVGAGGPRFFLALSPNDPQPNKGFLVVNTERADQIYAVMERVERYLVEEMPEATGRADLLFLGGAPLGTVKLQISGPDLVVLRQLGRAVEQAFYEVPGVRSVRNDWENSVFKLQVEVDQDRARRAGVTSEDVARTLSASIDGESISSYREGEKTIPIVLRAQGSDRGSLDRVRTMEVLSASQAHPVPLIQVADFTGEAEPSRIRRIDQRRAMTIAGKHPDLTAVELYELMQPHLDEIEVPRGFEISIEGEIKESSESNAGLFEYAPHALFAIVLLLVLQFNSFRRPSIILLTIPLILIGANYGLFVFGGYFDFTAMLGLFSLAGIIINNGIVLIDRIDIGRSEGEGVGDAIVSAALARARPIVMTTVTTVVGLVPLALFGGEFWYGMALVIMSGLGIGSFLTLLFVPVSYSLMFDLRGRSIPRPAPKPPKPAKSEPKAAEGTDAPASEESNSEEGEAAKKEPSEPESPEKGSS